MNVEMIHSVFERDGSVETIEFHTLFVKTKKHKGWKLHVGFFFFCI